MALSAPRPNMETINVCKRIEEHETVKEWLERRPLGTQRNYVLHLRKFCEFSNITPEQLQELDPKSARDLVWSYVKTVLDRPSVASLASAALKSFYRNHDGVTLPFDGSKGGKHNIHKRRTKACFEHVPTKREVYQIIDMSASLRDKAMYLILFESGIRVNGLLRLKYGHVREQLEKETVPLHLKITDDLDTKLRGYDLAFYDAFLGAEAVDTLQRYCKMVHKDSTDDTRLFDVKTTASVWMNFKRCIRRAGFDGKTMWVHSLRKAFKSELRKANIQEEISECLMGHRLKNSRENYMNRNDAINDLRLAYAKADFSREGTSQEARHENEIQTLKSELVDEKQKTEGVSQYLDELKTQMERMQKQLDEYRATKSNLNADRQT
jgi:site-specific recombinase XerD